MSRKRITKKATSAAGEETERAMPSLWLPADQSNHSKDPVLLIALGDLHLSLQAPVVRSCENDWLNVQARYLAQVQSIADSTEAPIVYTGDIFDRWSNPPELLSWAIRNLPKGFSVAGQHDLPLHRLQDIKKSSYWTLVEANVLQHLDGRFYCTPLRNGIRLYGFNWGQKIRYRKSRMTNTKKVAIVHAHIWDKPRNTYPGCPEKYCVDCYWAQLKGYDASFFGDNHKSFIERHYNIANCGTFIRRKADEVLYQPRIMLYHKSGKITQKFLDTQLDMFIEPKKAKTLEALEDMGMDELVKELMNCEGGDDDGFPFAVTRYIQKNPVSKMCERIILEALEKAK